MIRARHCLAFYFLLGSGLARAQSSAPTTYGTFTNPPDFAPGRFGHHSSDCLQVVPGDQAGTWEMVESGRVSFSSPTNAGYYVLDQTNQMTPRPWLNQVLQPGDSQFALALDRLNLVVFGSGGLFLCRRANTASLFGQRVPIGGLPPQTFIAPQLVNILGQWQLVACSGSQVWLFDLDLLTATAGNGRSFGPPMGGPNNYLQGAAVLVDPFTNAFLGWLMSERQFLSSRQRLYHTSSTSGAGPYHAVVDAPNENVLGGLCLLRGGVVLFPCDGRPQISQFPYCTLQLALDMVGQRRVPQQGGVLQTSFAGPVTGPLPQPSLAFMAIGTPLATPISLLRFTGALGLDQFILLPAAIWSPDEGIVTWQLPIPSLPLGTQLWMQALLFEVSANLFWFSNMAPVSWT